NYLSLMDHIGSGKDWDLARRAGGVKMLPPNVAPYSYNGRSTGLSRLEALKGVNYSLEKIKDEYVVLSDCDVICNIDLGSMIDYHEKSGADITLAVKRMYLSSEKAANSVITESDEDGRLTGILTYPNDFGGEAEVCLNMLVMKTEYLKHMVRDAIARNYSSLTKDVIANNLKTANIRVYRYHGYFAAIYSVADYFSASMELIKNDDARRALFEVKNRPVLTKIRNSDPTYYSGVSRVKNSLIADGCVIEGTVENSILFRGVKIGRNTTVRNSIIMQDTVCGESCYLNCVITDKNVVVRDGAMLSGAETSPFYVAKRKMI
ncbi:MAG: glucose-1-phosphate adenylyltransferase subunit GlgD, partial [Clostridia bacterium]|nr:glucose-1-phosphate adenylyltransferase subunit GlgD [Clostridia bacterium]